MSDERMSEFPAPCQNHNKEKHSLLIPTSETKRNKNNTFLMLFQLLNCFSHLKFIPKQGKVFCEKWRSILQRRFLQVTNIKILNFKITKLQKLQRREKHPLFPGSIPDQTKLSRRSRIPCPLIKNGNFTEVKKGKYTQKCF